MVTPGDLFHLLRDCVDLGPGPVEGAPSNEIGPIVAFAADPAPTELFKVAKLVGTLGIAVYWCGVGGVVTRRRDPSGPVEVSSHAVVVSHRGMLARMSLGVSNTHLGVGLSPVLGPREGRLSYNYRVYR